MAGDGSLTHIFLKKKRVFMNKYKIKTAINYFIWAALVFFTFFVVFYLISFPNKTIEQVIFLCASLGLVVWIIVLEREKTILQVELLKRLKADLLLKSDYAKAGVASKYKEEKETLVYVLGLLGYKKDLLETVEDIDNLLEKFKRPRQE